MKRILPTLFGFGGVIIGMLLFDMTTDQAVLFFILPMALWIMDNKLNQIIELVYLLEERKPKAKKPTHIETCPHCQAVIARINTDESRKGRP